MRRSSEFVRAGGNEVERQEEYLVRVVRGMYDSSSLEVAGVFPAIGLRRMRAIWR